MVKIFWGIPFGFCLFLAGCGEKPPAAVNEPAAEQPKPRRDEAVAQQPDKQPPKKNSTPPKNQKQKPPTNNGGKQPEFVKPAPGFSPLALPGVAEAPAGYSGTDQPEDADFPVDVQQKLNSDQAAPLLDVLRTSPYPRARGRAANELDDEKFKGLRGEIVLALRSALRDPNPLVIKEAMYSLRNMKAAEAAGDLVGFLYHPDENLREACLNSLTYLGPSAMPVVEPLLNALRDPKYSEELDLFQAVGALGPEIGPRAIPLLKKKMADTYFKEYLCEALGGVGAEADLLKYLNDKDKSLRENAAKGAIKLPAYSPDMVAKLIALVKSKDGEDTRLAAIEALGNVRPTTAEVIGALAHASKDKNERLRSKVAEALGKCEPKLPAGLPILVTLSKDKDDGTRSYASEALGNYQTGSGDRLLALLDAAQREGRFSFNIQESLEKSAAEFFPRLLELANDDKETPLRRSAAILALDHVEGEGDTREKRQQQIKTEMKKLLENEALSVLIRAAAGTAVFEYENPQAAAAAVAALAQTESTLVRVAAVEWVQRTDNKNGIPELIRMAEDPDRDLAKLAIVNLGYFHQDAAAAVPVLTRLAGNPQHPDLDDVIDALEGIAAQPAVCLPVLEKIATDKTSKLNSDAAHAMAVIAAKNEIDPLPTLKMLFLMIAQVEPAQRPYYIRAMGAMGPKAAPSVGRLIEFLQDKDDNMREEAASALGEIGPAAKAAAIPLVKLANTANHDRWIEVDRAVRALGKIKAGGAEFAKIVPTVLKNKDLHDEVLETLTIFGPEGAAAAPAIAELLPQLPEDDRRDALRCLKAMGPAAAAVAPAIETWLGTITDEDLRREAQETLKTLKP